jgi:DNA gyrase subunit B
VATKKEYTESDIQTLDWRDHVRLRPQLYFEKCFKEQTLNTLVFESLCHAFDEYYDDSCSSIEIYLYKNAFKIFYNSGMPLQPVKYESFTRAEAMMTKMYTCSNLKKHLHVGHHYCNIGMATINAVSEVCKLKTVSNRKKGIFVFENAETISKLLKSNIQEEEHTELFFKLDTSVFRELKFTYEGVKIGIEKIQQDFKGLNFKLINEIN